MNPPPLRIAMLGMVDGNGHPWSWSAILNGFDAKKMSACPYPVIPQYLNIFRDWIRDGARIVSTSCMRYAREFTPCHLGQPSERGELRFAGMTTCKSWERYGIHALEALYPIFGPGFTSVRNTGSAERNVVHLTHRNGADAVIIASHDMYGGFGCLQLCGTRGQIQTQFKDTFHAFRSQLEAFVHSLHSGIPPLPFSETDELMQIIIAGIESREQGGTLIELAQTRDPS